MALEDGDILIRLRNGGKKELAEIYSRYRVEFMQWLMRKYAATSEEAGDMFQNAILILYENVVSGRLTTLTSSLKTYLFSIGKNKLLETKRRDRTLPQMEVNTEEDKVQMEARLNLVERCLAKLGDPCRSLLIQFYYHKNSMDELSNQFGYKNMQTTKNQKYKCLERLRRMVIEHPDPEPNAM